MSPDSWGLLASGSVCRYDNRLYASRERLKGTLKGERSVHEHAPSLPPDSITVLFVVPSHKKSPFLVQHTV